MKCFLEEVKSQIFCKDIPCPQKFDMESKIKRELIKKVTQYSGKKKFVHLLHNYANNIKITYTSSNKMYRTKSAHSSMPRRMFVFF